MFRNVIHEFCNCKKKFWSIDLRFCRFYVDSVMKNEEKITKKKNDYCFQ